MPKRYTRVQKNTFVNFWFRQLCQYGGWVCCSNERVKDVWWSFQTSKCRNERYIDKWTKVQIWCQYANFTPTIEKISILQCSPIINYPVSYYVDKAYNVILGLIFGSAWTKTTFDRMRKTRHVSCKVLAWLDTELDISSWKLVCMDRKLVLLP